MKKEDVQIGMMVRIIGNTNNSCNDIGDIGTVLSKNTDTCVVEVFGRGSCGNNTKYGEIEPSDKKRKPLKCYRCDSVEAFKQKKDDIPLCYNCINSLQNMGYHRDMSTKPIGNNEVGIIRSKRTFGVELECLNNLSNGYYLGLSLVPKQWGLKSDGSIRGYFTREIVTCPLFGAKGEEMLQFGCDALLSVGYETNFSCGTHCHIGIPEAINKYSKAEEIIKEKRLRLLALFYTVFDPAIRCLLPKDRRNNGYCNPLGNRVVSIDKDTKKVFGRFKEEDCFASALSGYGDIKRAKESCKGSRSVNGGRFGINFGSIYYRGTIEIRYHEGSLDAKRLTHWIALHSAIVDICMDGGVTEKQILSYTEIKKVKELYNSLISLLGDRLDPLTIDYTNKRFDKYKSLNPKNGYIGTNFSDCEGDTSDDYEEDGDSDGDYY